VCCLDCKIEAWLWVAVAMKNDLNFPHSSKVVRLSSDICLDVYRNVVKGGKHGQYFLVLICLIVPESPIRVVLYDMVYSEPFRVKMFRWFKEAEKQGKIDDEEEERFLEWFERRS